MFDNDMIDGKRYHYEPQYFSTFLVQAVVPWYRQKKFYAGFLVVSGAIIASVLWGQQSSNTDNTTSEPSVALSHFPSSTPTFTLLPTTTPSLLQSTKKTHVRIKTRMMSGAIP